MTDFNDVTRTFTDALGQINDNLPQLILLLQGADKQFRTQKNDLTGDSMDFFGQGATAFANAVENNIAHGDRFVNKMSDFQLATSNLLSLINYNNEQVGDLERLQYAKTPYNTFDDYAPEVYGYTSLQIVRELREAAFRFSDMNTVMDKGKGVSYFTGKVDPAAQDIISDMHTQHLRKLAHLKDSADIQQENNNFYGAQARIEFLQQEINDNITGWFNAVGPALGDYQANMSTAANMNAPDKVKGDNGHPKPVWSSTISQDHGNLFGIPWLPWHEVETLKGGPDTFHNGLQPGASKKGLSAPYSIGDTFADYEKEYVVWNKDWGVEGGYGVQVGSAQAQADQNGIAVGANLVNAGGHVGVNAFGKNVALNVGTGVGLGFSLTTEKIGFTVPGLSTSISFGDGKSGQPS